VPLCLSPCYCASLRATVPLSVLLCLSPCHCASLRATVPLSVPLCLSPCVCASLRALLLFDCVNNGGTLVNSALLLLLGALIVLAVFVQTFADHVSAGDHRHNDQQRYG
jgi:hypothetical protein